MPLMDDLLELERGFWNATRDPDYYREHMAEDGLAVFGMGVLTKDEAIASTVAPGGEDWSDIELREPRLLRLDDDHAALIYEGRARRGDTPYVAYTSTVYARREGAWQLLLHQQSPRT
ncbi:MAG: nuclear transport factor 2 family protein [Dehalococcoidia bacterium]